MIKTEIDIPVTKLPSFLGLEKLGGFELTSTSPKEVGISLYAARRVVVGTGQRAVVPTGIKLNIPENYYGKIYDLPSIAAKENLLVKAGVIAAGDTDEVGVILQNCGDGPFTVDAGLKIAQLVIHTLPVVKLNFVESFDAKIENATQLELPLP
jgi:dUTP pyrophosphatase